jgi:flagellar hook assembly protein FlgD
VESNIQNKSIHLSWQGIEQIPAVLDIVLIDMNKKIKLNLRDQKNYTYFDNNSRQFSILVGQQDFVEEQETKLLVPKKFVLYQNHPNPFNPETTIRYGIPLASNARVEIFNLLGQRIRTLVNKHHEAGTYVIKWDGQKDNGQLAPSGLYIYRFSADNFVQSRKLILMR